MSTVINAGLPVEIGRIDKELGKLWEESGDTKTRASLINLAIYTENAEDVARNTGLIAQIASEHACRALLIYANRTAETSQALAWINAHCHVVGKGERQICSEQITFQLDGPAVEAMPSVVFSHLDSDLPLYFWWQGEFRDTLDEKLWTWIDRLIFDSAAWRDAAAQFAIARRIDALSGDRTVLCDLNWTRILGTRSALAQIFDHSCAIARLKTIEHVSITAANRTTGLLLLGWLAAQLGWKYQELLGKEFFLRGDGGHVEFSLTVAPGAPIGECAFTCADATFQLTREEDSDYYHAEIHGPDSTDSSLLVAAGRSRLADVLVMELSRGGKHPLYVKALQAIEPLL